MAANSVKARCRNCGRDANAEDFVLDAVLRMMVCPNCIRDRKAKAMAKTIAQKPAPEAFQKITNPAGWDEEDEYLQRTSKHKNKNRVRATRIDDEHVKFNCPKCNYAVTYNTVKKQPARCPYCSIAFRKPD